MSELISQHDLVISLIPYTHHVAVIRQCIKHKKHVVTTSYVSPDMQALNQECIQAGITCMNEIGVDPGIDHLWAVKLISEVHALGGKILEFESFCGGLPAPECSNNPLGYKFSWSARGVMLALRNNARHLKDGVVVEVKGADLMQSAVPIWTSYPAMNVVGYPNRDSVPYSERYQIPEAKTVIRGTLRYNGFPQLIQALVAAGYFNDQPMQVLDVDGPTKPTWHDVTCMLLTATLDTTPAQLIDMILDKSHTKPEDRERVQMGLIWLGVCGYDLVDRRHNLLDTLCAVLEHKMSYGKGERDMVLLQHKFTVELRGQVETRLCTLLAFGDDEYTAMARTVGVPCGLAVQLVLDGKLA